MTIITEIIIIIISLFIYVINEFAIKITKKGIVINIAVMSADKVFIK